MAKIINEIPAELEDDESTEVELEASEEQVAESKEEPKKEAKAEPEFEIEEEDDTPPEDRNREPLPDKVKQELEEDNLEEYSSRVKERMAQLKKAWHDERRAKEAEAREREEALRVAQQIIEENRRLKSTLSTGEEDYLKTLKESYEKELALAKKDYREAYDLADPDKISEAQAKMNEAQYKLLQAQQLKPQYNIPLQTEENSGQLQQNRIQPQAAKKPTERDLAWQEKNPWFGADDEMTSLAFGLHKKLSNSGFMPGSEEYYRRIDEAMHKRFPEYFGETESLDADKPAQRTTKPSTVVAPATRSTAPKKVRLTKTQLALAKKFKLTPEQYAKELLKTENANG
jgi:hypothetical protein